MESLRTRSLQVGQTFDQDVFLDSGQKLLSAGTPLTDKHLLALQRSGALKVIVAQDVREIADAGLLVERGGRRPSNLKVGQQTREKVVARTGTVLLEPGDVVEDHHVHALEAAGGEHKGEAAPGQIVDQKQRIDQAERLHAQLKPQVPGLPCRVACLEGPWTHATNAEDWPQPEQLTLQRQRLVGTIASHYAKLEAGIALPLEHLDVVVDQLIEQLADHPHQFTQYALLCPRRADYLPDHALTVTVLAMAIAASLNWSRDDVRTLAEAGLLFDLGMLLVPQRIRNGANELTTLDRNRVNTHPVLALALIDLVQGATPIHQLAALQHHERENGTGYPNFFRKEQICDLARVLAVADVFAAATSPRSYRKRKLPYIAMEETVRLGSSQILWGPGVKALLKAAGLFPVGSYLKLSSGEVARVTACNPATYDRPTVCPVDVNGQATGEPIDLAQIARNVVTVVRPLDDPTQRE